jgi:hypothetical protein
MKERSATGVVINKKNKKESLFLTGHREHVNTESVVARWGSVSIHPAL